MLIDIVNISVTGVRSTVNSKVAKRLHFLKVLKCSVLSHKHLLHYYIALSWPVLGYCSRVWYHNLTNEVSLQIEMIQKWTIRIIFECTKVMPYRSALYYTGLSLFISLSTSTLTTLSKPAIIIYRLFDIYDHLWRLKWQMCWLVPLSACALTTVTHCLLACLTRTSTSCSVYKTEQLGLFLVLLVYTFLPHSDCRIYIGYLHAQELILNWLHCYYSRTLDQPHYLSACYFLTDLSAFICWRILVCIRWSAFFICSPACLEQSSTWS